MRTGEKILYYDRKSNKVIIITIEGVGMAGSLLGYEYEHIFKEIEKEDIISIIDRELRHKINRTRDLDDFARKEFPEFFF